MLSTSMNILIKMKKIQILLFLGVLFSLLFFFILLINFPAQVNAGDCTNCCCDPCGCGNCAGSGSGCNEPWHTGTGCCCPSGCSGGCCSCFPPGTKITMADGSLKNIEDIRIDDLVLSYDSEICKEEQAKVISLETPIREGYYIINDSDLRVTDEHPIYTKKWYGEEGWAAINKLKAVADWRVKNIYSLNVGDSIKNRDGKWIPVSSIEYIHGTLQTYNIQKMEGSGAFYADGFLVHNKGCKRCSCSNPTGTASLVSPPNNSTEHPADTIVTFSASVSAWGVDNTNKDRKCDGCKNKNTSNDGLLVRRDDGAGVWQAFGAPTWNGTHYVYTFTGLSLCTTYKWQVHATNGCNSVKIGGDWKFKTNCAPEVISVTPADGWSGTEEDDDNASGCSDNNPQTFRVVYKDSDGYDDLYSVGLWIDNTPPSVLEMDSSMHGMITRGTSGGDWRMFGWSCNQSGTATCGTLTGCDCYKNYDLDIPWDGVPIPQSNFAMCSPSVAWSIKDDASPWQYYMNCLPGYNPVNWTITLREGFGASNLRMRVDWKVWFYDDIGQDLNIYAIAFDEHGERSGSWQDLGDWHVDLQPPTVSAASTPDSVNRLKIDWSVSDTVSEIRHVDRDCRSDLGDWNLPGCGCLYPGWGFWMCNDCEDPSDTQTCYRGRNEDADYPYAWKTENASGNLVDDTVTDDISSPGSSWTHTNYDQVNSIDDIEAVNYKITASDNACNQTSTVVDQQLGRRWLRTNWGDAYSANGYSVKIPELDASDPRDYFAKYITSTGQATPNFNPGDASYFGYKLYSYTDANKSKLSDPGFYEYLENLLIKNAELDDTWSVKEFTQIDDDGDPATLDWDTLTGGAYKWTGAGDLDLSDKDCDMEAVILVPSEGDPSGNLKISPEFGVSVGGGSNNGCLFIVNGNVTVEGGAVATQTLSASGGTIEYDRIYGFFVLDGRFRTSSDTSYDQLKIKGGVISGSVQFQRDLLLLDNLIFPAERISYDPRYLDIMKKYLGDGYSAKMRELQYAKPEDIE